MSYTTDKNEALSAMETKIQGMRSGLAERTLAPQTASSEMMIELIGEDLAEFDNILAFAKQGRWLEVSMLCDQLDTGLRDGIPVAMWVMINREWDERTEAMYQQKA